MITFCLMNVLLSIVSFFKNRVAVRALTLQLCSCLPVFNFTLNSFHVAELNWGSIRGVFETVRLSVCVCVSVSICVFGKVFGKVIEASL